MFRKSQSIVGSLIVCLTLLFTLVVLPAQSQSNVAQVIITDIMAEARPGEHPLITAYVSVLDDQGQHVSGLGAGDFLVEEFTNPVSRISVSPERQGVAVELLVDVSGSMEGLGMSPDGRLQDVQSAVGQFLGSLHDEDLAGIFTFCKKVEQIRPLSGGIAFTIPTDPALQFTCLFDAMWNAIEDLTGGEKELGPEFARMKKAIFVFSDGADSGRDAGCLHDLGPEFARMKKAIFVFSDGADSGRDAGCLHDLTDVKKLLIARDPKGKIAWVPRRQGLTFTI